MDFDAELAEPSDVECLVAVEADDGRLRPARSASAAAFPERARPTTSTRLPASSSALISRQGELEEVAIEEREARGAEDRADRPRSEP